MQQFGEYKFTVFKNTPESGFQYEIFDEKGGVLRHSKESFQYEGIARFAAIGHISLLEQGKG
jgi:hypothetical protein